MKQYFWFNIMCISISVFLMTGTVLVWLEMESKVINETGNLKLEIRDNTNKQLNNSAIKPLVSSTPEVAVTERDSSPDANRARNDTVNLAVPFTSQAPEKDWAEPWQDACEEAALLMLDAYYKNYDLSPLFARDEILKMVDWETQKGWGQSIEIEKIKQMAEEYFGLSKKYKVESRKVLILENPTVEDIKKFIASGNPVLVVADGKVLPNPHFTHGGPVYHALVIKGYDEENFITNDPGTQFGEGFKYKYNDLMNAIHDWNNGEVSTGKKVVLVVED